MESPLKSQRAMIPFNIKLWSIQPEELQNTRAVTSLDIFEGHTQNFHEDGLFSTLTFGRIGDDLRSKRFGYIDLRIDILHPILYSRLIKLKRLYGEIIAGQTYAVFNPETRDFEASTPLEGTTGYAFFMHHLPELTPQRTGSAQRDLKIELLERHRDNLTVRYLPVLPAALRDVEIGTDGRVNMDEVNELYQRVLMQTRSIPDTLPQGEDIQQYDRLRYMLTQRVLAVFRYFESLISGKRGFIQERWASRRVFDGTRNVISSLDTTIADLDQPNAPGFNDTVVGLYQCVKALMPKAIYYLSQSVVADVFDTASDQVQLVDPETYERTWVTLEAQTLDRWTTPEGHEKIINELEVVDKRHRAVTIEGYYLALVYADDQHNFMVVRSRDALPEGLDPKWLHPMTFVELIYLSGYQHWNSHAMFVTRYPIEQYNSSYPSWIYVKTTSVGELRYELGTDGQRLGDDHIALEFPKYSPSGEGISYHDAQSVNPSRLGPLGGDCQCDRLYA